MKAFKLLLVVLFVLTIASCEKSLTEPTKSEVTKTDQLVEKSLTKTDIIIEPGDFHNSGLDYVYNRLKEMKDSFVATKTAEENWWGDDENLKTQTLAFINDYFQEVYGSELGAIEFENALELGILASQSSISDAITMISTSNSSEPVKEYLIEIVSIDRKNYGTVISSLMKIKNKAKKELSGDDLITVQNTIDISLSSAEYWKKNLDNWTALFDVEIGSGLAFSSWWENIIGADIVGGVISGENELGGDVSLISSAIWAVVEIIKNW